MKKVAIVLTFIWFSACASTPQEQQQADQTRQAARDAQLAISLGTTLASLL